MLTNHVGLHGQLSAPIRDAYQFGNSQLGVEHPWIGYATVRRTNSTNVCFDFRRLTYTYSSFARKIRMYREASEILYL